MPKTIVITGAARGIGAACARRFAARGDRVALLGLEPDTLRELAAECGTDAIAVEADVRDATALRAAFESAHAQTGPFDAVIANAGIGALGPIATTDPDAFALMVDVNVKGTFNTIHAAYGLLRADTGYVVVLSSVAAAARVVGFGGYVATKAATEALAGTADLEQRASGVRVGTAYFSFLDTDLVRDAQTNAGFEAMRRSIPWPVRRVTSLDAAVDALVKGVDRRAIRIAHPKYIAPALGLRTLLWRADARRTAKGAPRIIAAYDGTDAIHDRTATLLKSPE